MEVFSKNKLSTFTYIVEPEEPVWDGVGLDVALKVDIVSGPQVVRVKGWPQAKLNLRLV